jgi:putative protease
VGYTGEREPKFFSTGARESALELSDLGASPFAAWTPVNTAQRESAGAGDQGAGLPPGRPGKPHLSVRAATLEAVALAARQGADLIYVGGEEVNPAATAWTFATLQAAVARAGQTPVVFATPRVTSRREVTDLARLLERLPETGVAGVMAANPGVLRLARATGLPVFADFGLNALNSETVSLLAEQGACLATGEPEASFRQLADLAQVAVLPFEVIAHGPLPAMILEHCVPAAILGDQTAHQPCPGFCRGRELALQDIHGQLRPLRCDQSCRNHLYLVNDVCILPYLDDFVRAGFSGLRIEGQLYEDAHVGRLVAAYRTRLDQAIAAVATGLPLAPLSPAEWTSLAGAAPRGLGTGAYTRGLPE